MTNNTLSPTTPATEKMIKIRRIKGGSLEECMTTCATIPATKQGILEYFAREGIETKGDGTPILVENIEVKYVCFDKRINWSTHIVVVGGQAYGHTDGPVSE